MQIRHETHLDEEAIHRLTLRAFEPTPFSNGAEADIIRGLRRAGDLALSLVAEEQAGIIGHVAFSPVTIAGRHDGWFGLGPIAVEPARQRQGVGRAMVETGLRILRGRQARGCILLGSPDIYGRMGFESDGRLIYRDCDRRLVQRIVFRGAPPRGDVAYAAAFDFDAT